jgi:hypothetical protein
MAAGEAGGSQPHVFETEDGHYMVKVRNNPQGPRVLVNELVAGLCLDWLEVHHPEPAIVMIDRALIALSSTAKFSDGKVLEHGTAFGSKLWQSDPGGTVSLDLIENKADVAGTLVFDTWIQQTDSRQYRVRRSTEVPGRYEYFPIDQGHSFGNPNWTPAELAARHAAIAAPAPLLKLALEDITAFIERLRAFTMDVAAHIVGEIPPDWLDQSARESLQKYLSVRAVPAAEALEAQFGK